MSEQPYGSQNPNPNDPRWKYDPNSAGQSAESGAGTTSAGQGSYQGSYQDNYQTNPTNYQTGYSSPNQPPVYSAYAQNTGYGVPSQPVDKPATPQVLKYAALAVCGIVVAGLIGSLVQLLNPTILNDQIFNAFGMNANELESELGAVGSSTPELIFGFVFSLLQYAVYIVFTIFMLKGHNWARIVLTVILGLTIVGGFFTLVAIIFVGFHWLFLLNLLGSVLSAVALVLLWLKPANDFYSKMKMYNQWKVHSQYR